jgi:hypothetical protein
MTAAVVVPLPVPSSDLLLPTDAAEARKRRREILSSQRLFAPEIPPFEAAAKRPKLEEEENEDDSVSDASSSTSKKKKPQLRYDPDVPMSKEEAAVWRREQRRKRNRESAAASRQRQRDRIVELEAEVDDWKIKYEEIMSKIRQLEEITGCAQEQEQPVEPVNREQTRTPPLPEAQVITPRASPTVSGSIISTTTGEIFADEFLQEMEEEDLLPSKMISRPA